MMNVKDNISESWSCEVIARALLRNEDMGSRHVSLLPYLHPSCLHSLSK